MARATCQPERPVTAADQVDLSRSQPTAILGINERPNASALFQNYPNPFNPETIIAFQLESASTAKLVIYNSLGQAVRTLVDAPVVAGVHRLRWNAADNDGHGVAAGTYFYHLTTDEFNDTGKMTLIDGHKGSVAVESATLTPVASRAPEPAGKALEESRFFTISVTGDDFFDYARSGVALDEDRSIDMLVNSSADLGMVRLGLTDAPVDGADAVLVTINTVDIRRAGGGPWQTFVGESRTFDLLSLTGGVNEVLGEQVLEPGEFSGVRLIVESAQIVIDGETFDLEVPSGEQRGIQLQGNFSIVTGETLDLMMDFDARKSITQRGNGNNFALKPVVRMVPTTGAGFIAGRVFVDTDEELAVVVIATQDGEEISSAIVDPEDGTYRISFLEPGLYDLHLETELVIEPAEISQVEVVARRGTRGVHFGEVSDDEDDDTDGEGDDTDGEGDETDGEGDDTDGEGEGDESDDTDATEDDGDSEENLTLDNAEEAWGIALKLLTRVVSEAAESSASAVAGQVEGEATVDMSVGLSGITYVVEFTAMSDDGEVWLDGEVTIETADGEQFDYDGELTFGGAIVGEMAVDMSGTTDGATGTLVVGDEELVIE